ncbi:MAG TPA: aminoglycoside phosphotransferase family protein [Ktedonobacterales bacterium]|nr:aminoglycoside phosphotransferase family protein [Ktedonobacterales bacterium]
MYEQPDIAEERLRACLRDQYALAAASIAFLPLGLDSRAGVYRVVSEQGIAYLLKAKAGTFYEPGCLVPRYLRDQGIAGVVAPLPTKGETLWVRLDEWIVTLYPFIEGEHGWNPAMSAAQWRAAGAAIRQIHQVRLPTAGFESLRRETFDPTEYHRSVCALEIEYIRAEGGSQAEQAMRSCWQAHQPTIDTAVASLEKLAGALQKRSGPHVICHADLHPSNIIRQENQVFVIDWDDVMLAPRERDFLFVGAAPANGTAPTDAAPFFQGYGALEIDWVALTYYLWERVVQDLIAYAEEVFLRGDLGATSKAAAVKMLQAILSEKGNGVDKAAAAAAHLPADLGGHL